ncbi:hypothetical protein [Ralstonia chuxiongensis]|uniref:hypothetical protein n=1 Tax=Ralstonia chuxiongensis TaxID=2957504 RepID=UPI00292E30BB|nr:hypothetical protein [Ralstonia chuxiongensis]
MPNDGDAPIVQLISSTFVRRQCSDKIVDSHDSRASVKSGQEAPGGYKLPGAFFLLMGRPQTLWPSAPRQPREERSPPSEYCRSNRGELISWKKIPINTFVSIWFLKKTSVNITRRSCASSDGSPAMVVGIRSENFFLKHQLYFKVLMLILFASFMGN